MRRAIIIPLLLLALSASPAKAGCMWVAGPALSGQGERDKCQIVYASNGDQAQLTWMLTPANKRDRMVMILPVPAGVEMGDITLVDVLPLIKLQRHAEPVVVEIAQDMCRADAGQEALTTSVEHGPRAQLPSSETAIQAPQQAYALSLINAEQAHRLGPLLQAEELALPPNGLAEITRRAAQGQGWLVLKPLRKSAIGYPLPPLSIRFAVPGLPAIPLTGSAGQDVSVQVLAPEGQAIIAGAEVVDWPQGAELPQFVGLNPARLRDAIRKTRIDGTKPILLEHAARLDPNCTLCSEAGLDGAELAHLGLLPSRSDTSDIFGADSPSGAAAIAPEDVMVTSYAISPAFTGEMLRFRLKGGLPAFTPFMTTRSFTGESCAIAEGLPDRHANQARLLAELTGWPIDDIRMRMIRNGLTVATPEQPRSRKWHERLWDRTSKPMPVEQPEVQD